MKRFLFLALLSGVAIMPVYAQQSGWVQTWSDEFDGTTLNTATWNIENSDTGDYGGDQQYYRPENTVVSGGTLKLITKRESFGGSAYTSGAVTTRNKKTFGGNFLLEVSAKIPKGQGLWPAIWTREGSMPNPNNGIEYDLMENLGRDPRTIYVGAHRWAGSQNTSTVFCPYTGPDYSTGQHIYSVEVLNGVTRFYVDRALRCGPTSNTAPVQPSHLLMNTSVGGSWGGPADGGTVLPQTFEIDYVRLYSRGTAPPPEVCGNGIDDDGDGQIDEGCSTPQEICGNGIDDDGDGQIDEGCTAPPEVCGNGIDDDGDGQIDEGCTTPPAGAPSVTTAVTQCSQTLTATPPNNTGGWVAQFQRNTVNIGSSDSTSPYSRTVTVSAGSASYRVRWTKSGASTVTSASVTKTCP